MAALLGLAIPSGTASGTAPIAGPIQPEPGIAARGVLVRLIGARADGFMLTLVPPGTRRKGAPPGEWYRVGAAGGRVSISGTSQVALVRGAYAYLERIGAASVSWEGRRVALPARFPDSVPVTVATPFAHRLYLNTCTFGYTTPWWDWDRWEREIDWMAIHGIDMPLAMEGQEAIWRRLWIGEGLSRAEVAQSLSGPAFLPWQRMGNIEGYRAPLPQRWIAAKRLLQKRILRRMRALGMEPVLPAFAGYVPKAFAERHPAARIYRMRPWEGFAGTYWLDPADPLFATLARRFQAIYRQVYGPGRYRLADAFNEMVPPIADDGSDARTATYGDGIANTAAVRAAAVSPVLRDRRLAEYGGRLYTAVTQGDPDAVWVMQGWLFGADKRFWTPEAIRAFLSNVPDKRLLVLDIGNDRYPGIWQQTDAFYGKPWVYGYVHNYGGSNPVYGDLDFYRQDIGRLRASPMRGRNVGFGMFPEGLHSNPIVYDYAYDLAWSDGTGTLNAWLGTHLRARYGQASPAVLAAWRDVIAGVYGTRYWTPRWWENAAGAYLLFKRPTARIVAFEGAPGDQVALRRGIAALLALPRSITREPLFRADLVDLARHGATIAIDAMLQRAVAAYTAGDVTGGDRETAAIRAATLAVDRLIGEQQDSLATWTDAARRMAGTPAEAAYYMANAKAQIGPWGGEGHLADYASKAWQGMYADYYLPRWMMFLASMRTAAVTHRAFDEAAARARITAWEQAWVIDGRRYRQTRPVDPVGAARALMMQTAR